jgi:hypothetical protein
MSEPKLSKKNLKVLADVAEKIDEALAEYASVNLSAREEEHFSGRMDDLENHLSSAMEVCNELTPNEDG